MHREEQGGERDWLTIARIVKTQGRMGELAAELETDVPERFETLQRVFLRRRPAPPVAFGLREHWSHKGRVILGLEGVADMNAAEAWIGAEVVIPWEERVELPKGKWYFSDLEGCTVYSGQAPVGTLTQVEELPGGRQLLHVAAASGEDVLVPFVPEWIESVDLDAREMRMRLPEGLLDLNAGGGGEEKAAEVQLRREQRKAKKEAPPAAPRATRPAGTTGRPPSRKKPRSS